MESSTYIKMENNTIANDTVELAADFIAEHEGLILHPYKCPAGVSTIGYCHALKQGEVFDSITQDKALHLLKIDTAHALAAVLRNTKSHLTQNQQIALTSFVYNLGLKAYIASMLRQKINRQEYVDAANEFNKWIYAGGKILKGLITRRQREKELFLC